MEPDRTGAAWDGASDRQRVVLRDAVSWGVESRRSMSLMALLPGSRFKPKVREGAGFGSGTRAVAVGLRLNPRRLSGAEPGKVCWFRICAVNVLGQGPWSEPARRPVM